MHQRIEACGGKFCCAQKGISVLGKWREDGLLKSSAFDSAFQQVLPDGDGLGVEIRYDDLQSSAQPGFHEVWSGNDYSSREE